MSASAEDPYANSGPVPSGTVDLHLWYVCHEGNPGLSAAEFALVVPADATIEGFSTASGFLNAGSATQLLLAVAGCPDGPLLAGTWHIASAGAGSYCLAPGTNGTMIGVECVGPWVYPAYQRGYSAGGTGADCPRTEGFSCGPVPVHPASWGAVKSLYR